MQDLIGYDDIIEGAMRNVIYKVLKKVEKEGLKGSHYFVIAFSTKHPEVVVPKYLQERFPEEMSIVIQYQYSSLKVEENQFKINLSFSGNLENLIIPYNSILSFADPSINFGLKFNSFEIDDYEDEEFDDNKPINDRTKSIDLSEKVISLDAFRKNRDKKD